MKNKDVALKWVDCMINNKINHPQIIGSKLYGIDNYLVSYTTPICEYIDNTFKCSTKFYSKTTSRHMYYLNLALCHYKENDPRIILVEPVEYINRQIYR
jgi:hypothetical protein